MMLLVRVLGSFFKMGGFLATIFQGVASTFFFVVHYFIQRAMHFLEIFCVKAAAASNCSPCANTRFFSVNCNILAVKDQDIGIHSFHLILKSGATASDIRRLAENCASAAVRLNALIVPFFFCGVIREGRSHRASLICLIAGEGGLDERSREAT